MTDDNSLHPTLVLKDDIEQEADILKWLGKKANKRIIYANLQSSDRLLYFGDVNNTAVETAQSPWPSSKPHPEVIETIVKWALKQPEKVQKLTWLFLETSDEGVLEELMVEASLCEAKSAESSNLSIAEIIRRSLPLTKDEMIQLVQRVSPQTKRPAATARQFIRSNIRSGQLRLKDEVYSLVK